MCKILVIEDDPNVRANTVDLLKEEGYEVLEAENGRIGIDKAIGNIPDLIISDIMMPEADGFTVYRELQNNILTASIPFILLSAKTEIMDIRSGMNMGADDYITKPFKTSDLLKSVNTCLNKSKKIGGQINENSNILSDWLPLEKNSSYEAILDFSELIKDNPVELSEEEIRNIMNYAYHGERKVNKYNQKPAYYRELENFLKDKKCIAAFRNCCTNSIGKVIYNTIIRTAEKYERRNDLMVDIQDGKINIFQKHLEIAVAEMVENACRFSKKGTTISIFSAVEENKYILSFLNNGKNIKEEQIIDLEVLDKYDRTDFIRPGSGLGIVEKIMKLYNGLLSINDMYTFTNKVKLEFRNYHI
jgi:DNA-binding response OmpR family regulator